MITMVSLCIHILSELFVQATISLSCVGYFFRICKKALCIGCVVLMQCWICLALSCMCCSTSMVGMILTPQQMMQGACDWHTVFLKIHQAPAGVQPASPSHPHAQRGEMFTCTHVEGLQAWCPQFSLTHGLCLVMLQPTLNHCLSLFSYHHHHVVLVVLVFISSTSLSLSLYEVVHDVL